MSEIKTITTAIVYPNAKIHVGWAWECLGADWLNRGSRILGQDTHFVTGMDEHSLKVQRAAEAEGLDPKAYCDKMAIEIKKVLGQMGIAYDRFIRTSDDDHHRVVEQLIQRSFDNEDLYESKYEGYYCDGCEAYYTEKDLVDGHCPQHEEPARWISEENYFFRLSKFQEPLLKLFRERPDFLQPASSRTEILNFIEAGLKDFSISRANFTWGIPLPFKKGHVIYVWFDALINYLTACGVEGYLKDPTGSGAQEFKKLWPAFVHIIGKDISRFHCVYWPAMLMSMGIPLPEKVFAHGWLNFKGKKMSKSTGTMIHPDDVINETGPDPFRYYLLADNSFSGDANFGMDLLVAKFNADLANDWGNLVNRSISMTRKYFPDEELALPTGSEHSEEVRAQFEKLGSEIKTALDAMDPAGWAKACGARTRTLNLYIDQKKPWKLAKQEGEAARKELKEVL